MELVVCSEESAETSSGLMGLVPTFRGELYPVVGDGLVDVAVL